MNMVFGWIAALWAWIVGLFDRPYRLVVVEGRFPDHLNPRRLYVLTEDGDPWEARMICPCGCAAELDLSLLPDDHPTWRFSSDRQGRATLHPSVWRKIGCKSHFFLRGGKIVWA